jgi:hypothetical protein
MDEVFKELEEFAESTPDVEGEVIRESRVHRVLKNIIKMAQIPLDTKFSFKTRSQGVLKKFNKALGDGDANADASKAAIPNGDTKTEKEETEPPSAAPEADKESKEETKPADKPADPEKSADGDVDMKDAPASEEKKEKEVEATA